jgi:5'-nucleotidase (lipoprotein e(P4) family)
MRTIALCIALILLTQSIRAQDTTLNCESKLKELSVLFQQTAAEYRALCYQAFNIATLRLNAIPKRTLRKQKLAIITDLDETILDNSYSEARMAKEGKTYTPQLWKQWSNESVATAVPGAVEFLQAAHNKGIAIFYISNRDTTEIKSTLVNLQNLQLPDADTSHMLFLVNTSSKEVRRQTVTKQYNVVMLLGDNLGDFTQAFEKKPIATRFAETDVVKEEWGKKFIVLPNATYGEWESAIYDYERSLTPQQKEAKRVAKMKGY